MIKLDLPGKAELVGDILIKFMYWDEFMQSEEELFRTQFNTSFIGPRNDLDYSLKELTPEKIH